MERIKTYRKIVRMLPILVTVLVCTQMSVWADETQDTGAQSSSAGTSVADATAAAAVTVYKGQDYSRVYDYEYYIRKYPSVRKKCGTSKKKALKNFVNEGMAKGRRGCASFSVKSYIHGNADLRKKFGNDLSKYYLHYQNKGYKSKKRRATATGITKMQNLRTVYKGVDYSSVYSWRYYRKKHPELYKKFGYNDYAMLEYYVLNDYPKQTAGKASVDADDFTSVDLARFAVKLSKTKTAKKTDQILLVMGHQFSRWNKGSDGTWTRDIVSYCGYGKNGLSANRSEGDNTTPIGSYPVLYAFGKAADPGTKLAWKTITAYSYFSGVRDATYNTWVESRTPINGEHLADYYQYEYALFFGYNVNPTVIGKGSAIFLHVKSVDHWYTAGCVSLEKSVMIRVITEATAAPYIIIVPDETALASY